MPKLTHRHDCAWSKELQYMGGVTFDNDTTAIVVN
jgi:hypothetical protein